MKRAIAIAALVLNGIPLGGAAAETLVPSPVFEAKVMTPAKNGAMEPLRVSVQSWEFASQGGAMHEIPLRGFYVAHLLSGDISTTIDRQTTRQPPGAYWTIKSGATMQVKVIGEFAVLETIVVSKQ